MTEMTTQENRWLGFIPRRGRGLVIFILLIAAAFCLGWLLSDGSSISESDNVLPEHVDASPSAWTCSMHPQIQLPTSGKCPICFMDLIPVSSDDESLDPRQLRMTPAAAKLAQIQTAPVRWATAATEVDSTAWTRRAPRRAHSIRYK